MAKGACVWMLLILTSATSARAGCPQTSGMTDPVVMMCQDGYSHGSSVYIDTSAASGTDNEAGPVCTCSAEIRKANIINITTTSSREVCGSRLIYNLTSTGKPFLDSGSCKEASFRKSVSQSDSLVIDLEKTETPFDADYCIHLEIETCKEGEFQCVKDGKCLPKSVRCDGMPDCADQSDEGCIKISCQEGEVACASGDKCYPSNKRCDNVTDCTDGSDEFGCGSGVDAVTTEVPETGPVIYVNCTESTRFTTTTTTTTTTTSTTTTTTPTTTTTTPTMTTTEDTTTTVIVAATTESDTTVAATTESDTTVPPMPTTTTSETSTSNDALKTTTPSTSIMTSSVTQNTTSSVVDPDVVKTSIWRNPIVIAAIVLGVVVAIVILGGVPYCIYYKVKRMKSKTLKKSPDLWVDKSDEKELEPLNSPLP